MTHGLHILKPIFIFSINVIRANYFAWLIIANHFSYDDDAWLKRIRESRWKKTKEEFEELMRKKREKGEELLMKMIEELQWKIIEEVRKMIKKLQLKIIDELLAMEELEMEELLKKTTAEFEELLKKATAELLRQKNENLWTDEIFLAKLNDLFYTLQEALQKPIDDVYFKWRW